MTLSAWLAVMVLIGINALYVAAEFAVVASDRGALTVLARAGNRRAGAVLALVTDGIQLDRYIAACQIGITLSSLLVGAFGQATIAIELAPLLREQLGVAATSAHSVAALGVLLVLTGLQVILGELVPKSLALQYPERTALATLHPVRWSVSAYRGFIWLLNGSALLLLRPFGVTPGGHQHVHSPREIALLLAESRRGGTLTSEAHQRLQRGLQLSARTVRQMMVPRSEIYALEASTSPELILSRMLESPYSRVPIYRRTLDHVVGAVSTKDVAAIYAAGDQLQPLSELMRPMPRVPDSLPAHRLVRLLQEQRASKAIVIDAAGRVAGIISIEDVLAELFGDICDELKQPEPAAGRALLDGSRQTGAR